MYDDDMVDDDVLDYDDYREVWMFDADDLDVCYNDGNYDSLLCV